MDRGRKEIQVLSVLIWGGEVLSHETVDKGQPCSLIVQNNFQTSIILQVKCIYFRGK